MMLMFLTAFAAPGFASFLVGGIISLLPEADVHHAAQISACGQDIASRGSFAAAFVGNFHGWTHPRRSVMELPGGCLF